MTVAILTVVSVTLLVCSAGLILAAWKDGHR